MRRVLDRVAVTKPSPGFALIVAPWLWAIRTIAHLEENLASASIYLSPDEFQALASL